jgi:ligand-binding sensor domain-containing protein
VRLLLISLLFCTGLFAQNTNQPIGTWRDHLPYGTAIAVTASPNKIYAATPYSIFSVDISTEEIERYSKVSGLNETGISTLHYDPFSQKLWIAYTNSNIDVITTNAIINIPDLKRETVNQDKTIYHIYSDNTGIYAATGLGIIVLNPDKYEIKDSWIIGNGGHYVKTYMLTKDGSHIYAATEEGLKRTAISNPNPADFSTWEMLSGKNGLAATGSKGVVNASGKIIALQNDSLFVLNGSNWNLFYRNGLPITSISVSENRIVVAQDHATNNQVVVLNSDGSIFRTLQQPAILTASKNGLVQNGMVWIADSTSGLSRWDATGVEQYQPNAPAGIITGEMISYNNQLYATAGGVTTNWQPLQQPAAIYQYKEGNWTNTTRFTQPALSNVTDLVTIAVDPRDESIWAGSFGSGLLHLKTANQVDLLQQAPLSASTTNPGSIRVSGLAFDSEQNLWVSNFGASNYLHVLKANNTWQSFTAPFGLNNNALSKIIIDDANQLWMVAPNGNGLLLLNHNNTIDNKTDDKWRLLRSGRGNGNLPSNEVLTIAKDKSGYIWVGTNDGIGIIQCPQEVFTSIGCEALLPVAQQGNFANYLFKGEEVRAIAIDGADRKWIGTRNGIWLISAEGDKVIERFTEENSPLPGNDVQQLAIDGTTGEVFIATAKGLMAYKGTATEATTLNKELFIYPNPVAPSYSGTIAIKGLSSKSTVKITELNGRLVFQTRSLGGQATWNGKDIKGNRVATGVYLVLVTDEQQQERAAGKIVFIGR